MWTSERGRLLPVQEPEAEIGVVTLGGNPAGVSLGGERRWLPVCCPGGYAWRPGAGDKVLVLKAGAERESPCILGMAQSAGDLQPGEVRLSGGGSSVSLKEQALELEGEIKVNGMDLRTYIQMVLIELLNSMEG